MDNHKLRALESVKKDFITFYDIARTLGIKREAVKETARILLKSGILLRVREDLFVLKSRWEKFPIEKKFQAATYAYAPSYVSLSSALAYHGLIASAPKNVIELMSLKKNKRYQINQTTFLYYKIEWYRFNKGYLSYDFLIAGPEKAVLDIFLRVHLKKYDFDLKSIDYSKLDKDILENYMYYYPVQIFDMVDKYVLGKRKRKSRRRAY